MQQVVRVGSGWLRALRVGALALLAVAGPLALRAVGAAPPLATEAAPKLGPVAGPGAAPAPDKGAGDKAARDKGAGDKAAGDKAAQEAEAQRQAARQQLAAATPARRLAAVEVLGRFGLPPDADALSALLSDEDEEVQAAAQAAIWRVWSRSGDPQTDARFQRGLAQMAGGELTEALETFSEIIRQRPDFTEAWNKRATVLFLLGDFERSLSDCGEVFKRNPRHFGALSGAAQMHLQMGHLDEALDLFERARVANPALSSTEGLIQQLREHRRKARQRQSI